MSRRDAWLGRARDAHDQARGRRDEAKALITAERKQKPPESSGSRTSLRNESLLEPSSRIEEGESINRRPRGGL